MARDMELREEAIDIFKSTIWLDAKTPEAEEFEISFEISETNNDKINIYKDVIEYIADHNINVINKKHISWLR
jgi:hypothetical protein